MMMGRGSRSHGQLAGVCLAHSKGWVPDSVTRASRVPQILLPQQPLHSEPLLLGGASELKPR